MSESKSISTAQAELNALAKDQTDDLEAQAKRIKEAYPELNPYAVSLLDSMVNHLRFYDRQVHALSEDNAKAYGMLTRILAPTPSE